MADHLIFSTIVILVVLLVRYVLGNHISQRLKYALWLIVALRLLVPFNTIESPYSLMNIVHVEDVAITEREPQAETEIVETSEDTHQTSKRITDIPKAKETKNQKRSLSMALILKSIWLIGFTGCMLAVIASNIRFYIKLRKNRIYLFDYKKIKVYQTDFIDSACLYGMIPSIYVNSKENHEYILIHEYMHFCHLDFLWAVVRCVCVSLYWFHPLVWLCAYLSLQDGELACDEAVIHRIGEEHRKSYGQLLIQMIQPNGKRNLLLCSTNASGSKSGMKKRIQMIVKNPKTRILSLLIITVICAGLAVTVFTAANIHPSSSVLLEDDDAEPVEVTKEEKFFMELVLEQAMQDYDLTERMKKNVIYYRLGDSLHIDNDPEGESGNRLRFDITTDKDGRMTSFVSKEYGFIDNLKEQTYLSDLEARILVVYFAKLTEATTTENLKAVENASHYDDERYKTYIDMRNHDEYVVDLAHHCIVYYMQHTIYTKEKGNVITIPVKDENKNYRILEEYRETDGRQEFHIPFTLKKRALVSIVLDCPDDAKGFEVRLEKKDDTGWTDQQNELTIQPGEDSIQYEPVGLDEGSYRYVFIPTVKKFMVRLEMQYYKAGNTSAAKAQEISPDDWETQEMIFTKKDQEPLWYAFHLDKDGQVNLDIDFECCRQKENKVKMTMYKRSESIFHTKKKVWTETFESSDDKTSYHKMLTEGDYYLKFEKAEPEANGYVSFLFE
ncbi:MAG: M56 family metallopeptidase [Lachnospiraceae bacterium]|nr:M56 family metallopeptidase [Lachnospiraceae bacterium]